MTLNMKKLKEGDILMKNLDVPKSSVFHENLKKIYLKVKKVKTETICESKVIYDANLKKIGVKEMILREDNKQGWTKLTPKQVKKLREKMIIEAL